MKNIKERDFRELCRDNSDKNYVVFTHTNRRFPHPDYLIRRGLSLRYGIPVEESFSHTGSVWWEDGRPVYYHQTFPVFSKDNWGARHYSIAVEISDPDVVEYSRKVAKKLYKDKRGYGVGQLISFFFTLWFTWLNNPIKAGKVCSEAVAVCYPQYITTDKNNTDPQQAFDQLLPHATNVFRIIPT